MSNLVGTRSTSKAARTHWASICPRHLQVSGYFYRKVFQSQVLPCDTLVGSLTECVPGRSLASFPIDDCPGRQSSVVYPYIFRMSPRSTECAGNLRSFSGHAAFGSRHNKTPGMLADLLKSLDFQEYIIYQSNI
jgi:hypothetical protein